MSTQKSPNTLNIVLWTAQILLAVIFLITGAGKLFLPMEKLYELIPWTKDADSLIVRLIGFSEFIASLGLILPSLLRVKPLLTPWAATGVAVVMLLAIFFNISMGELHLIVINVVLLLISVFVAWGRFEKSVITPRF